uniref:Uncharacterized protein n=1 Tax=viral metagenome TaxID=1070528 RepID=A0A6C0HMT6_9ZZZZ
MSAYYQKPRQESHHIMKQMPQDSQYNSNINTSTPKPTLTPTPTNFNTDDIVFEQIETQLTEQQIKISHNFIDVFYYLIVSYSKSCFKRHGNWKHHNYQWQIKTSAVFDYKLANDNLCHRKLLDIQRKMQTYRKDYLHLQNEQKKNTINSLYTKNTQHTYITIEFQRKLFTNKYVADYIEFAKDSLRQFSDIIIKPIKLHNLNIVNILKVYSVGYTVGYIDSSTGSLGSANASNSGNYILNNPAKRSRLINYDALQVALIN